ncbi:MAG: hypothetical protein JWR26_1244 [Pedosphaera sp.]|nr:hypothetical protein [Pedosphaera sp.]
MIQWPKSVNWFFDVDQSPFITTPFFKLAFLAGQPKIPFLTMENKANNVVDTYSLIAWLHTNQKRVVALAAAVLIVGGGIGMFIWHGNHQETQAADALSNLKSSLLSRESTNAPDPGPYLKLANEYPGTAGGARATLIATGILFDQGKFPEAQAQYEKFLQEHSDYPLVNEAALGLAASLEAQGKTAEAIARYEEVTKRREGDSTSPQAKSALARLYLAQNKPDSALKLYEDLIKEGRNSSWNSMAQLQREVLLTNHPELRKQPVPPQIAPTATVPMPESAPAKPAK